MKLNMLHLTVTNKSHPGLDLLLASAKLHGIQSRVLRTTKSIGHGFGFGLKLELLQRELGLLPPDQKVVFTDAFDVLFQDSLQSLEEWISLHPKNVLVAAEKNKWPDTHVMYPVPLQFPFPYLNAGVLAGYASQLLTLFRQPYNEKTDDQAYYTQEFLTGSTIVLDHSATYIACLAGVQNPYVLKSPILHLNNGITRMKHYYSLASRIGVSKSLAFQVVALEYAGYSKEVWRRIRPFLWILVVYIVWIYFV